MKYKHFKQALLFKVGSFILIEVKKQLQIFFDFLRFCIGSDSEISSSLKEVDWKELYAIAKKQCLVGVLFDGIKKLPAEHVGIEVSVQKRIW